MEIIIGKNAGFCYGVKRAVDGTMEKLNEHKKVNCFGELVHNKIVINDLKEKGVTFIEKLDGVSEKVIIRAHGVSKEVYDYLEKNEIDFFDYTCPNVLNIHKIAKEYNDQQYFIFLLGDKNHPENIGTISFCGDNSYIIENENNVEMGIKAFKDSKIKRLLIIVQTTFSVKVFNTILERIRKEIDDDIELVIKNTICNATEIRQKETEEIAKKVQYMIIIGGRNSSNTKKLYEIACSNCENSICIEDAKELNLNEILKYKIIGIMAGASTPQNSVLDVKKYIDNMYNANQLVMKL